MPRIVHYLTVSIILRLDSMMDMPSQYSPFEILGDLW